MFETASINKQPDHSDYDGIYLTRTDGRIFIFDRNQQKLQKAGGEH